ncbi:IS5 family transposase [Variovorax boronicumulans]|nr:IS5 family transposase [Variovorax boronicumulans]
MLHVDLMQNWFALSDPAMEEALYEIASLRAFAGLGLESIPDETTILSFRHLLEASDLAEDIFKQVNAHLTRKGLLLKRVSIANATIIAAPSSTKNESGERDPEMHRTKTGNQWHFGMKAHIGVDAHSGLAHTVTTTANEADVEQVSDLLHCKEDAVWADSGYRSAQSQVKRGVRWHIAGRPNDMAKIPEGRAKAGARKHEYRKVSFRAKDGASVPSDQAAVRSGEGEVQGTGQEHGACDHAVCAVKSVDGPEEADCDDGAGTSTDHVRGHRAAQTHRMPVR